MALDLHEFSNQQKEKLGLAIDTFRAQFGYSSMFYTNFAEVNTIRAESLISCFEDPYEALECSIYLAAHLQAEKTPSRFGLSYGQVTIGINPVTGRDEVGGASLNDAILIKQSAETYEVLISVDYHAYLGFKTKDFVFQEKSLSGRADPGKKADTLRRCFSVHNIKR